MRLGILLFALLQGYITVDNVTIGGDGPFRFLLDTGSESTIIDNSLARRLALVPAYRVSLATAAGSTLVPAATVPRMTIGAVAADAVEVLWHDLSLPAFRDAQVDGILGNNVLSQFDYVLDFKKRALMLASPSGFRNAFIGQRVPIKLENQRIVVPVQVEDGPAGEFVLDSGTVCMVVPAGYSNAVRNPSTGAEARLQSPVGQSAVTMGTIPAVTVGQLTLRNVCAAVQSGNAGYGLLPANLFDSVYVNFSEGYVLLNPQRL